MADMRADIVRCSKPSDTGNSFKRLQHTIDAVFCGNTANFVDGTPEHGGTWGP